MIEISALCFVLLALAAYVARPLYTDDRQAPDGPAATPDEARRRALEDLEVDRASGLLDEAAYEAEKAQVERRD